MLKQDPVRDVGAVLSAGVDGPLCKVFGCHKAKPEYRRFMTLFLNAMGKKCLREPAHVVKKKFKLNLKFCNNRLAKSQRVNHEGASMTRLKYRAIFISDVHLGTRDAQAEYLLDFLRHTESDYLYLVGDIFDLWKLKSGWYWPQIKSNILHLILDKARRGTRVIYIPGNHDERLRDHVGMFFNGVSVKGDHIHETADGKKLLLIHGDEFDSLVLTHNWLTMLGTWSYDHLLWINRQFNTCRRKLGFPYWSLSSYLKGKVRNAVEHIRRFEEAAAGEARRRDLDGVVCGHIHKAAMESIGGVLYCNTGDWVEHCTALTEDSRGRLSIINWAGDSVALLDESRHDVPDYVTAAARRRAA
jgi:UDP-2,3-diacylglucosamine pyrophosphatase LpxH